MAKKDEDSWFTKWLRNGRLSGLTFLVIFIAWIWFSVVRLPTTELSPLLLLSGGAFVGNLAIKKDQDDKAVRQELKELKERVENNESTE
jgi:hypothetical protein